MPINGALVLRHDVDFCLESACRLAEVEADAAVSSTYFVLLRSPFYNLYSPEAQEFCQTIMRAGHTIGLHFDPQSVVSNDLETAVRHECEILSEIIGKYVQVFSFHRPTANKVDFTRRFPGLVNAYEPRFFNEIAYCSDSRGAWHYGHPLNHEAIARGASMQLLTHPIWWVYNGATPVEKLEAFLLDRQTSLRCAVAANSSLLSAK